MLFPEGFREPIKNPADLERRAEVSQAKAYQFARTFRDLGFLQWNRDTFGVSQRRRLFDLWYEEERRLLVERYPARPIYAPGIGIEELVKGAHRAMPCALAGFAACQVHGVHHVGQQQVPELHIFSELDSVLDALDLERCPDHLAEIYLLQTPYRESVQRGVIDVQNVPVVDVLQAALDVARTRGREQAEFIVTEVLGWS